MRTSFTKRFCIAAILLCAFSAVAFGQAIPGLATRVAHGAALPTHAEQYTEFILTSGSPTLYICTANPCMVTGDWIASSGGGGGVGTITGVTTNAGSGLAGGGFNGTLDLSLLKTCSVGQTLQYSGSTTGWVCATAPGTGTITGTGSANTLARFNSASNIVVSLITDNGTSIMIPALAGTSPGNVAISGGSVPSGNTTGGAVSAFGGAAATSGTGSGGNFSAGGGAGGSTGNRGQAIISGGGRINSTFGTGGDVLINPDNGTEGSFDFNADAGGAYVFIPPFIGTTGGTVLRGPQGGAGSVYLFQLPNSNGTNGQFLQTNGSGVTSWQTIAGSGTVTGITFSSPLSGGTINISGTVGCPTCDTSAAALTSGQLLVGAGGQALASTANATLSAGALALGQSGTAGSVKLFGSTSGNKIIGTDALGQAVGFDGNPLFYNNTGSGFLQIGGTNPVSAEWLDVGTTTSGGGLKGPWTAFGNLFLTGTNSILELGNTVTLTQAFAVPCSTPPVSNKVAKFSTSGSTQCVTVASTSDVGPGLFVALNVGGGGGDMAVGGVAQMIFDGATTVNDWVVTSITSTGSVHDTGSTTFPTGTQALGRVQSTNGSAGTYSVAVFTGGGGLGGAGSGTVTHTAGALTLGKMIVGNGSADVAADANVDDGITTPNTLTVKTTNGLMVQGTGVASVLGIKDSSVNCPVVGLISGFSYFCSGSFTPQWITDISGVITSTTIETQSNKDKILGYSGLDGSGNILASELDNYPSALFLITGNTSMSANASTVTVTLGDYGASPTQTAYGVTDTSTSSTDNTPDFYVMTGSNSFHCSVDFGILGTNQFQVCRQPGPQGEIIIGSAVAVSSINQSPFAKFVVMSQTGTHQVERIAQLNTASTANMLQLTNATAASSAWYFISGCAGATGGDTGCGSGTTPFSVRGDGFITGSFGAGATAHGVLLSEGPASAAVSTSIGTAGQLLTSNGAGVDPSFQTLTALVNPATTLGDTLYENATPTIARLAGPTTPNGLTQLMCSTPSAGLATAPAWCIPGIPIDAQTTGSPYSVPVTDNVKLLTITSGTPYGVTGPALANNYSFAIANRGAGLVTYTPASSTVNGAATQIIPQNWFGLEYTDNSTTIMPVMPTLQAFINCPDTGGNHYNFNSATGQIICGTSTSSSAPSFPLTVAGTVTQGGIPYFNSTTQQSSTGAGAAKQLILSGGTGIPTFTDFPERNVVPLASCVNGTAASGLSYATSTFTAACRAGTNNLGAALQAIPATGANGQFLFELPQDWDTTSQPFISIYYTSGSNSSGTVIWTASSACSSYGGSAASATDDPTFHAETAFSTQTMSTANRYWNITGQFSAMTSGNNCAAGTPVIIKLALSGTAASNINAYQAVLTVPRLLTVQAN